LKNQVINNQKKNQTMKKIFYVIILIASAMNINAQKETFDVISYTQPAGWQKTGNEGGVQMSVTDKKTNGYALAIITKATASTASANENFSNYWERLVKSTVQVKDKPIMQEPSTENGWEIISGGANYTDGANTGMATLLSASGGGQTVSVVLMTNTKKYQDELLSFLNSLELAKAPSNTIGNETTGTTNNSAGSSIAGLWTDYHPENNGYSNGLPQLTGGYIRSEYLLNPDGTYIYRVKNWLVYGAKYILFIYETGTYSVSGNSIIFSPKRGRGGWWNKTKRTSEWGSFVKASDYKPEKKSYPFEIKDYSGPTLVLKTGNKNGVDEYRYTKKDNSNESLIDNPPGFNINTENGEKKQAGN
jgi:hypothetical protein